MDLASQAGIQSLPSKFLPRQRQSVMRESPLRRIFFASEIVLSSSSEYSSFLVVLSCWGLVLKCYELRTRQHKMLNVNVLRP